MSKIHYAFNIDRLPVGTKFHVINGAWVGEIVLIDGVKHLGIAGDTDNPSKITSERGKRSKLDIEIEYLPSRVEPLPFVEGETYTECDVMDFPVGTTFYEDNRGWYGEIVVTCGRACLWVKETGDFKKDSLLGNIVAFDSYVVDKVTVHTLGEDIAGKTDRIVSEDALRRQCLELFRNGEFNAGDWVVNVNRNEMSRITKESDIEVLRDLFTSRGNVYRKATLEEIRIEERKIIFEKEGRMLDSWKVGDAVENGIYAYGRVSEVIGDMVRVVGMGEKELFHKREITPAYFVEKKPKVGFIS
ncbi:hypothetical protein [Bacillus mycoides]|uniref:hypothetical protein n=1 Tax=Bacillus mycoides TaxID=1405 RepID=UPI003A812147